MAGVVLWPAAGSASGLVQPGEERAWRRLSSGECRHVVVEMWTRHVAVVCRGVGEATGSSGACPHVWVGV
jgi:hypothetical protein